MDQSNLLKNLTEFNNKSRPRAIEGKGKMRNTFESVNALYEGRELILNAFRSGIFSIKETHGRRRSSDLATRLKILRNASKITNSFCTSISR